MVQSHRLLNSSIAFSLLMIGNSFGETTGIDVSIQTTELVGEFEIRFTSELEKYYIIEESDDLETFTRIESLLGNGESQSMTYSVDTAASFFRVAEQSSPFLPEGIRMVSIPAGSFTMGSLDIKGPLAEDHKPVRTVNISAFQMSETEVTNRQYLEFLNSAMADGWIVVADEVRGPNTSTYVFGADGQPFAGKKLIDLSGSRVLKDHTGDSVIDPENPLNQCWIAYDSASSLFSIKDPQLIDWDAFPYESGESRSDWPELAEGSIPSAEDVMDWPVNFIKWYGAHVFALYYGCDLPTEAEWEYAAKGGSDFKYATNDGSVDSTKANYNENNLHPDLGHVVKVKTYSPNPYGLYDLSGNVWEWCRDWYDPDFYANSPDPDTDPVNDELVLGTEEPIESPSYTGGPGQPYNGDTKVRRGGSWNYHEATLESSYRERDFTWRGNDHFGFRIVLRP